MFACVFAVFLLKIAMRYAPATRWPGPTRCPPCLFVWIVFWANAFLVPTASRSHSTCCTAPAAARARAVHGDAACWWWAALFAWALPGVVDYLRFLWRERTPVLGWRLDWVYACFGLFVLAVVVRAAWPGWSAAAPAAGRAPSMCHRPLASCWR